MIELSLKINGELPFSDPFVGVVGRSDSQLVKSSGAKLLQPTKQQSEFQIDKSKISFNVSDLTEGEVLLIFPTSIRPLGFIALGKSQTRSCSQKDATNTARCAHSHLRVMTSLIGNCTPRHVVRCQTIKLLAFLVESRRFTKKICSNSLSK